MGNPGESRPDQKERKTNKQTPTYFPLFFSSWYIFCLSLCCAAYAVVFHFIEHWLCYPLEFVLPLLHPLTGPAEPLSLFVSMNPCCFQNPLPIHQPSLRLVVLRRGAAAVDISHCQPNLSSFRTLSPQTPATCLGCALSYKVFLAEMQGAEFITINKSVCILQDRLI